MISQTVEYALRAVVTIAQNTGVPCTAQQISQATQVPAPYLSKLMQGLVKAGIVSSQRGIRGGFVLAKEPVQLTIWEVAHAVDPFRRIQDCPLGLRYSRGGLCSLHRRLDAIKAAVEEQFRNTTIADVLADSGDASPLCRATAVDVVLLEHLEAGTDVVAGTDWETETDVDPSQYGSEGFESEGL
ncbi:MAG: Rrf2 family transcriptional regulator [Pirellulales bacterium]|nr:Rrf2 family transcriptional regulator [Pirellulales bacterium]